MLNELRKQVCDANRALVGHALVILTWGNVSGIDRARGIVAIKPSGVEYAALRPQDIVLVDLDGKTVEGALNPSSDTPTHLALYRAFGGIGGVTHTHSPCATAFAQARRGIPCFGTTHADHFFGEVPVTRLLRKAEVAGDYEAATGAVIVERFRTLGPLQMPAVLVAGHGPFTWGRNAADSVRNSVALESVAEMALHTLALAPSSAPLPEYLRDKHFLRKHGSRAYYGQK